MSWLWLNISLGGLFVLAVVGIPLWMVIKQPGSGPGFDAAQAPIAPRRPGSRRAAQVLPGAAAVPEYREVPAGA
jgi:hypothetical protein